MGDYCGFSLCSRYDHKGPSKRELMAVSGQEGVDEQSYSQQGHHSQVGRDGKVSCTPRRKCLTASGPQSVRVPFSRVVRRCLSGCLLRMQQVHADTERRQE